MQESTRQSFMFGWYQRSSFLGAHEGPMRTGQSERTPVEQTLSGRGNNVGFLDGGKRR